MADNATSISMYHLIFPTSSQSPKSSRRLLADAALFAVYRMTGDSVYSMLTEPKVQGVGEWV